MSNGRRDSSKYQPIVYFSLQVSFEKWERQKLLEMNFFCLCMATKVWHSYLIICFAFTNFPTNMSTPHFYKSLKPIEHIIMTHLMGHFIIYWPHTACGHLNNEKQCIKYYPGLHHMQLQIQIQIQMQRLKGNA